MTVLGVTLIARTARHISGFLKCAQCGGNLTILAGYGRGRKAYYGCTNHANRHSCPNDLRESEAALLDRLLSRLQAAVLTREMIEFAITEFEKQLKARLSSVTAYLDADRKREAALQSELKKLTAFILNARDSDDLDPVRDEINERNRELKQFVSAC